MSLVFQLNPPNRAVVTVSDLLTEPNTLFDWQFRHIQSGEVLSGQFQNVSDFPETYDAFDIDLTFPYAGQYEYKVTEYGTGKVLEVGMVTVVNDQSPAGTDEHDYIFNIFGQ